MNLRIHTGENPYDLSDDCLLSIAQKNVEWPQKRAFLIVPDQTTADVERRILELRRSLDDDFSSADGYSDALMLLDVVSFSRLERRILEEVGGFSGDYPDAVTKTLILFRILTERKEDFQVLSAVSGRISFVSDIQKIIDDFTRYRITPDQLSALSSENGEVSEFYRKMEDFSLLMRLYQEDTERLGYEMPEREPEMAVAVLEELYRQKDAPTWPLDRLSYLKDTSVWVAGFGQTRCFTPQEWNVVYSLYRLCEEVNLYIAADRIPFGREEIREGSDAFFFGRQTIWQIKEKCPEVKFQRKKEKPPVWPAASFAAGIFADRIRKEFPGDTGQISLRHFESPVEELRFVAGEINRLVREHPIRYRDIRVVLCDYAAYESHLHSVFSEYGLDPFLDKKHPLSETVLMRFILAFLDLGTAGWSFSSLMACLKSGLCHITLDEVDRLENYCLKYGLFKGYRILERERFLAFSDPEGESLWEVIQRVLFPLKEYIDRLQKVKKGKEKAELLLSFLDRYGSFAYDGKTGVAAQIQVLSDQWAQENNQDNALALVLAFSELNLLLERMKGPVGDIKMSLRAFRDMMESGMGAVYSGAIPTYTDQIEIADSKRRGWQRRGKILFLVGASRNTFPYKKAADGYLRGVEREKIAELLAVPFPSGKKDQIYSDSFVTYALLLSAEERLYISYGQKSDPSVVMRLFEDIFPGLQIRDAKYRDLHDPRLFSEAPLLRYVSRVLSEKKSPHRAEALAFSEAFPDLCRMGERTADSRQIPADLVEKRYGGADSDVKMSISQVEMYAACPFRHFAGRMLSLRERPEFQVRLNDVGDLLHAVVESALSEFKKDWREAATQEAREEIQKYYNTRDFASWSRILFDAVLIRKKNPVTWEEPFIGGDARRILRTAQWSLAGIFSALETEDFNPEFLEWRFGRDGKTPFLFSLPDRRICIDGIVDRVDISEEEKTFRIIDYKSGSKKVDYTDLYHGYSLQLPLYVQAFKNENPQWLPKEAGYFHMATPMISVNSLSGRPDKEFLKNEQKKEYALSRIDLPPTYLEAAGHHAVRKMKEYTGRLFNGEFPVAPCKRKRKDPPCVYCEFTGVCGIDPGAPPVLYAKPLVGVDEDGKKMKEPQIFSALMDREGGDAL